MTICSTPNCDKEAAVTFCEDCLAMYRHSWSDREEIYSRMVDDAVNRYYMKKSNIPPLFADLRFENIYKEVADTEAYRVLKKYADSFVPGKTRGGVVVTGLVGRGKTTLAVCLIRSAGVGFLCSLNDILNDMRATYGDDLDKQTGYFDRSMSTPLLVIDDLGSEKVNEKNKLWVEEIFYRIIEHRYRECLPTVVTTNATMADLNSRFGERVMSRLIGISKVVLMEGPDLRMLKR